MGRIEVAKHLNACLNALCRGYLFYQRETRGPQQGRLPWGATLDPKTAALFEEFLRQDEKHVTDLIDAIDRLGEHPELGAYDLNSCNYNYLDPKFFLRTFADHLEQDANAFDAAAKGVEKDPTVGGLVRGISADKRKQVVRTRELAGAAAAAVAARP